MLAEIRGLQSPQHVIERSGKDNSVEARLLDNATAVRAAGGAGGAGGVGGVGGVRGLGELTLRTLDHVCSARP